MRGFPLKFYAAYEYQNYEKLHFFSGMAKQHDRFGYGAFMHWSAVMAGQWQQTISARAMFATTFNLSKQHRLWLSNCISVSAPVFPLSAVTEFSATFCKKEIFNLPVDLEFTASSKYSDELNLSCFRFGLRFWLAEDFSIVIG